MMIAFAVVAITAMVLPSTLPTVAGCVPPKERKAPTTAPATPPPGPVSVHTPNAPVTSIVRALDEGSDLRVAASYSAVGREYFTTLALGAADVVVESRGEERVNIDAALRYAITPTVVSTISAQLQSASIDRRFGAPAADAPITSINRRLSELMIDLDAAVVWSFERGTFTVGGALYRRDEQNGVVERFAIEPSALASLRSQENQRDNATRRSRMNARLLWTPSQRDTVEAPTSHRNQQH